MPVGTAEVDVADWAWTLYAATATVSNEVSNIFSKEGILAVTVQLEKLPPAGFCSSLSLSPP